MAWDPTKPANADLVFNSVGSTAIRGNFSAIDTAWDINHIGIGDTNQGKHSKVHLPEASTPTTAANEVALYSQYCSLTTQSELRMRNEGNGAEVWATAALKQANTGWTYLPSGILLKWGQTNGTGSTYYSFPTGATYPTFSAIYQVFCTPIYSAGSDSDIAVRLSSIGVNGFTFFASPRTTIGSKYVPITWLAIGV